MTTDSDTRRHLYRDLTRARTDVQEAQSLLDELEEAHQALLEKVEKQTEALAHIDQLVTSALEVPDLFDRGTLLRKIQTVAQDAIWTRRNLLDQPERGASLAEWCDWIAESEDETEAMRRVLVAGGHGADTGQLARYLKSAREAA